MASYINKRAKTSSEAVTGGGDLVGDVAAGRTRLDAVKEDELPDSLRKLDAPRRAAELNSKLQARNTLNEKLATLVKKRDSYVVAQRDKAPPKTSSFDRSVAETLRAQIKR
jgi:hypothetical protein